MDEDNAVNQEPLEKQKLDKLENDLENLEKKAVQEIPPQPSQPVQQPDIPQPTSSIPPVEAKPQRLSKSKGILWTGVALMVLALVGVGAYYLGSQKNADTSISEPVQTQAPTPTLDPTAEWSTYISTGKGITFKVFNLKSVIEVDTQYSSYLNGPNLTISTIDIFQKSKSITCEQSGDFRPCLIKGSNWEQKEDIQPTMISGYNSLNYYIWNEENLIINVVEFQSPFLQIATPVDGAGLKERFDQTLSTFKFIEATPSATTTP